MQPITIVVYKFYLNKDVSYIDLFVGNLIGKTQIPRYLILLTLIMIIAMTEYREDITILFNFVIDQSTLIKLNSCKSKRGCYYLQDFDVLNTGRPKNL